MLGAHTMPAGLRPSGTVDYDHHLLPAVLPIIIPLVMAMVGQSGVVVAIPTAKVVDGFGLATKVGLDNFLAGGVLGGVVRGVS